MLAQDGSNTGYVPEARWSMEFHCFRADRSGDPYLASFQYYLDLLGQIILKPVEQGRYYLPRSLSTEATQESQRGGLSAEQVLKSMETSYIEPLMLAFCFCHCKNVEKRTEPIEHALFRKRAKTGKIAISRTHTLVIDPMRKVLREEGQSEKNGFRQALHICRGHFKTYDEKPLFGKTSGTFWWPGHVRGSMSEGIMEKDYHIKATVEELKR